ncbi:MAG TPA: alpha-L-rhamnosidase C-terminal domain-containing protein [Candidatus Brocadiia bacterium]|nr:alpha-L-rhamnosidase C-terminal domain-containing protein [Candidatus Brocadiia bacterium]
MEWKARWIWLGDDLESAQSAIVARRVVSLKTAPKRAELRVSASHIYRLYVNGALVGRGPDRADPRFPYFDTWDVAPLLKAGANVVVILAWRCNVAATERMWCLYNGPAGLLAQVEADGRVVAATGADWKVRRAPGWDACKERISRFTALKHSVDLTAAGEMDAFMTPGYNDAAWSAATAFPFAPKGPLPQPIAREIPFLIPTPHLPRHIGFVHSLHPNAVNTRALLGIEPSQPTIIQPGADAGWVVFDFGRPMGGFPDIALEPQGAGCVDVYYGEGACWVMADKLRFTAAGTVAFQPLDWRGARFMALHFHDMQAAVALRSARFIEMVYPFKERGDFRCADEAITAAWRVSRQTAWACVKDHPMDCLNREQALWIADLNIHARSIASCFGDLQPVVKALRQAFRVMHDDGVVPVPGPVGLGYKRTAESLPWSEQPLTLAMTLRDLYWQTGDKAELADALPKLEKVMAHFARYQDARGLLRTDPPGLPALMCFGGWNPMLKQGTPAGLNFEYALSLRAAADVAAAAGRKDLAKAWAGRSQAVRQAARETFWNSERFVCIDGERDGQRVETVSLPANAWAALCGAVLPAEAGSWAEAMRAAPDVMRPVSPFDASLLLEAFASLNLELHVRWLLDLYFGSIVRANQPTMPEFWSAEDATSATLREDWSRCHPYGSGPAWLLPSYVLGVRPAAPGWRKALIQPAAIGLASASGRVPTPRGDIAISWEKTPQRWTLEADLPKGVKAEVRLGRLHWGAEHMIVDGTETWRGERWDDWKPQIFRQTRPDARVVSASLDAPGRHTVVLETT